MVVRLAESMELTLRERNDLLALAGFTPAYPESALTAAAIGPVREALEHILTGHLPYPAVVVDRYGDLVAANPALALVIGDEVAAELLEPPVNVYRLALHPRGISPRIENFAVWAQHIVAGLHRARINDPAPDSRAARLHAELSGYVPPRPPDADQLGFAVPLVLRSAAGTLRLLTTVTTFATALDVTLAELRLEAFLPADADTAAALTRYEERRGA